MLPPSGQGKQITKLGHDLQTGDLLQPRDDDIRSAVYQPRFFLADFLATVSRVFTTLDTKRSCIHHHELNCMTIG